MNSKHLSIFYSSCKETKLKKLIDEIKLIIQFIYSFITYYLY